MKKPVLLINSGTNFNRLNDFRLLSLRFGICLMIALSSNGSVLPFNYANNGLGPNWTLVFHDDFTGTSLNKTNWDPYWFSDGTLLPGSSTHGYATNVTVNGQLNLREELHQRCVHLVKPIRRRQGRLPVCLWLRGGPDHASDQRHCDCAVAGVVARRAKLADGR